MKKLIVVRHCKSCWKDLTLDDYNRPLNKRGNIDGSIMSNYLSQRIQQIDFLQSSSSVRTFETSKFFKDKIKFDEIEYKKDLYHSSSSSLIKIIKNYLEKYNSVLLIAHNPGLTNLINSITNISLDNLPTTGLVEIDFHCNKWKDISIENSNLIDIKFPKQLK